MIEYVTRIDDFWTDELKSFVFPHTSSAGQRDSFHSNYSKPNNDLPQAFDNEIPNYQMFSQVLGLDNIAVSWTSIEPGQAIPIHQDAFYKLRQQHSVGVEQCVRFLIFLQDWELGHFVEFKDFELTRWANGDVYKFDYQAIHCAANASNSRFITCQVNTIK